MSETRKILVLIIVVLAFALLGRLAWEAITPHLTGLLFSAAAAVPGWLWWVAFGLAMAMLCPLKIALFGKHRGSRFHCAGRHASG